jgi:hypothetical protein
MGKHKKAILAGVLAASLFGAVDADAQQRRAAPVHQRVGRPPAVMNVPNMRIPARASNLNQRNQAQPRVWQQNQAQRRLNRPGQAPWQGVIAERMHPDVTRLRGGVYYNRPGHRFGFSGGFATDNWYVSLTFGRGPFMFSPLFDIGFCGNICFYDGFWRFWHPLSYSPYGGCYLTMIPEYANLYRGDERQFNMRQRENEERLRELEKEVPQLQQPSAQAPEVPVAPTTAPQAQAAQTEKPQRDTYEFGYLDKICPEQYVSEGNSLLNYLFDKFAEKGGKRYHAYAVRNSRLYTLVRDENNKNVLKEEYSAFDDKNPPTGPEFVNYLGSLAERLGIDMRNFFDVEFREYTPRTCSTRQ